MCEDLDRMVRERNADVVVVGAGIAGLGFELFHAYREGDRVFLDADGTLHRYHGDDAPRTAR